MTDCGPIDVRRVTQREVRSPPKNWFTVSPIAATGLRIPNESLATKGLPPNWGLDLQGYVIDIPRGMMLWSLSVDYPSASGNIIIGINNPPIPIRFNVPYHLSTDDIPCDIVGPLRILVLDPADDVNFGAIIAEIR